ATIMSPSSTPGIADPYWYEWTVGLEQVVALLNPDNQIASVTFQAPTLTGLDDVAITLTNGDRRLIQVKHTRADRSLTFSQLVVADDGDDESLLAYTARVWHEAQVSGGKAVPVIFTNRGLGRKPFKVNEKAQTS